MEYRNRAVRFRFYNKRCSLDIVLVHDSASLDQSQHIRIKIRGNDDKIEAVSTAKWRVGLVGSWGRGGEGKGGR